MFRTSSGTLDLVTQFNPFFAMERSV